MKKLTQKIKPFIASSLIAMAIVVTPFVSFADNEQENNNYEKTELRVQQHSRPRLINRFLSWFGGSGSNAYAASISMTPSISGITAPTVLKAGETGTWTVNASDPNDGSLSYAVDWGDNNPSPLALMMPTFVQTSTFTHVYTKAGTYTVKFTVSNTTGQKTTSTVTVHIVGSVVGMPVISNLSATSTKPRQATIKWDTDVKSTSLVWYSTTSPVDTSIAANISRATKILHHKINLTKLTPDTTYYIVVGSADSAGKTMSSEISFTTPALPSTAPVITSLTGPTSVVAGQTETVTVNAYDPRNGSLSYSADWGDSISIKALAVPEPIFTQSATFDHVYDLAGTYTATFTVANSDGQRASSSMTITVTPVPTDTTAPVIGTHEDITAKATSSAGAIVTYTAPDATDDTDATAPAVCTPASGSTFAVGTTTVLCDATDSAGNKAVQTSFTVTVTADTTAPVISDIATTVSVSGSTITWTTDEPTTSEVFYGTTTPIDVNSDATASVVDNTLSTSHSIDISSLTAGTLYHFVIQSTDASDNTTLGTEGTFTTNTA